MASAYVGSTLMPMIFGQLQQVLGIRIVPLYLLVFAILNIGLLEIACRQGMRRAVYPGGSHGRGALNGRASFGLY